MHTYGTCNVRYKINGFSLWKHIWQLCINKQNKYNTYRYEIPKTSLDLELQVEKFRFLAKMSSSGSPKPAAWNFSHFPSLLALIISRPYRKSTIRTVQYLELYFSLSSRPVSWYHRTFRRAFFPFGTVHSLPLLRTVRGSVWYVSGRAFFLSPVVP